MPKYDIHTSYMAMARKVVVSPLGVRSQTVIPKAVREALSLRPGDQVGFVITRGRVNLIKIRPSEDDPFATFKEWQSEADRRGYRSL